jgi:hypothetical protein
MRTRTVAIVLALATLAVSAAACTGDGDATDTGSISPTASALPTTDADVTFVPGEWTYEYLGVRATVEWKDGPAILTVKNGSGAEVGAPALYVVTQDQQHVDGKMDLSEPLANDATGEYTVTFPGVLQPADAGLIVLMLGDENWGALSPKVVQKNEA